jgi:hypothetical protein
VWDRNGKVLGEAHARSNATGCVDGGRSFFTSKKAAILGPIQSPGVTGPVHQTLEASVTGPVAQSYNVQVSALTSPGAVARSAQGEFPTFPCNRPLQT